MKAIYLIINKNIFELIFYMGDVAPFFSFIFTFFKWNWTHGHVRGSFVQ